MKSTAQLMFRLKRVELITIFVIVFKFAHPRNLASGEPLNDFVSHFEPLNYDKDKLVQTHQRVRRSLDEDSVLHLDFNAHGREFKLRLKRDTSIFTPDFQVDSEFDPAKVYKGHADGHLGSHVHGFVHDGIFEGKISLSEKLEDEYHVEPSSDHFNTPKDYHSVIYKASDVHYPYAYGKDMDLNDKTKKWMKEARKLSEEHFSSHERERRSIHHRYKRAPVDKVICPIQLQADHLFTKGRAGSSKERAMLLMTKHVQAAHEIYSKTVFQIGGQSRTGYGFAIRRMRANDTADSNRTPNPYKEEYIGVEKFLDIISLENNKDFCLSHVFTYRDFEDGVLGLAWVGEPAGRAAGGICEIARRYSDGRTKTLNTGVVTFINYNKQVPSRVSEVTFAHELGHNFGSKHDSGECQGLAGGNFIMFPKATSGTDANNRKFSSCSIDYISPVIDSKASTCFIGTNASICGNNLVEGSEECDCGFAENCKESCCNPAGAQNECKRKSGAVCSPSEGLCCDKNCQFSNRSVRCNKGECINDTHCSGTNSTCPEPVHKPNDETDCNSNRSVCLDGECKGSRCRKFDKTECQCKESENQCVLCCMEEGGACSPHNEGGNMIKLLPGAPCNQFQGYCDILEKCRGVDSEGPLERIKNILFGGEAIENFVGWVKTYWWATILIGIGLILLMAGFIKVCSVATPSSNPNKPKAKTMSLRRNPRHHTSRGFVNEAPPPYDIEMGRRGGRNGGR